MYTFVKSKKSLESQFIEVFKTVYSSDNKESNFFRTRHVFKTGLLFRMTVFLTNSNKFHSSCRSSNEKIGDIFKTLGHCLKVLCLLLPLFTSEIDSSFL